MSYHHTSLARPCKRSPVALGGAGFVTGATTLSTSCTVRGVLGTYDLKLALSFVTVRLFLLDQGCAEQVQPGRHL